MAKNLTPKSTILDAQEMARIIRRMAGEIVERNGGVAGLMLAGIRTRGVPLAERIAAEIERMEGQKVPLGLLDITLYRDDLSTVAAQPLVKGDAPPASTIDDLVVVLCDDVLYTGRTVRAALDALIDFGRPAASSSPSSSTADTASFPSRPTSWARWCRPPQSEVIEVSFQETDETRTGTHPGASEAADGRPARRVGPQGSPAGFPTSPRTRSSSSSTPPSRSREVGERPIKKVPTLRGKTVINLFFEASTRTRVVASRSPRSASPPTSLNFSASGSARSKRARRCSTRP